MFMTVLTAKARPAKQDGRLLRPFLRAVIDAGDLYCVLLDLIDSDVRQRRKHELSPPRHPASASTVGRIATIVDGFHNLARGSGIVLLDALKNAFQVFGGEWRPPDP